MRTAAPGAADPLRLTPVRHRDTIGAGRYCMGSPNRTSIARYPAPAGRSTITARPPVASVGRATPAMPLAPYGTCTAGPGRDGFLQHHHNPENPGAVRLMTRRLSHGGEGTR